MWYVASQIDFADFRRLLGTFEFGWAAFAALAVMMEIPLVALRWRAILKALAPDVQTPVVPMLAITAIGAFLIQVIPNAAADAVRVWLLTRMGRQVPVR